MVNESAKLKFLKKDVIKLKRDVDKSLVAISRSGLSKAIKEPENKRKLKIVKLNLKKALTSVRKFIIKYG